MKYSISREIRVLTRQEMEVAEIINNPVVFFNMFIPEIHKDINISYDYQDDILLNRGDLAVVQAGRSVGKTVVEESDILRTAWLGPDKQGLLTTPNKSHIDPLFNRLINFASSNKLFKNFVTRKVRSPEYQLEFSNGFILYGRIAGTSKGAGLLSLHVDYVWVDEGQLYLGLALDQLQGCMNPECRVRIFGVPNGLRNSYLVKAREDSDVPAFSKYKISRLRDPNFTEKNKKRLVTIYGGENSISYRQQVLAEDDVVTKSTFNPRYFTKCFLQNEDYDIETYDGTKIKENDIQEDDIPIPSIPDAAKCIYATADIGYDPDPSIFGLIYEKEGEVGYLFFKYIFRSITYTKQAKMFDHIASNVNAEVLAIDEGGPGRTITLDLLNEKLYPHRNYKVLGVQFGGNIPIGVDDNGDIIKERAKFYSTVLMQRAFQRRKILLPESDLELFNEVHSSTQAKTIDGKYTYTGIDHNLDMLRCFFIAKLLKKLNTDGVIQSKGRMDGKNWGFFDM